MLGIRPYYRNKSILITGGTGLVGKVLIESFLRKLPEVEQIYILIRAKEDNSGRTRSAQERFRDEIVDTSLMDTIRCSTRDTDLNERIENTVTVLEGDLTQDQLGLSSQEYQLLTENLDLIINSAALTQFDAPVDLALETNTYSVNRVLTLARSCDPSPFVAHVSTCFVNNSGGPIPETPVPPDQTPHPSPDQTRYNANEELDQLEQRIERIKTKEVHRLHRRLQFQFQSRIDQIFDGQNGKDPKTISEYRDRWLEKQLTSVGLEAAQNRGWNDTYTFTKALGEQLFQKRSRDIPGLILRPSIIESSWRSPAPGWLNGFRMLDPLLISYGRGKLDEFPGNPESFMDIIPADFTVNALLSAIPFTHRGNGPSVYQVASGMENPLQLRHLLNYIDSYFQEHPLRGSSGDSLLPSEFAFPTTDDFVSKLNMKYLFPIRLLSWALGPVSFFQWADRTRTRYNYRYRAMKKLRYYANLYGPYAEFQHCFLTNNTRKLLNTLSPDEKELFPFDVKQINWKEYFQKIHIPGIKKYLLGQDETEIHPDNPPISTFPEEDPPERTPLIDTAESEPDSQGSSSDNDSSKSPSTPTDHETTQSSMEEDQEFLSKKAIPGCFYRPNYQNGNASPWKWVRSPLHKKCMNSISLTGIQLICSYYLRTSFVNQDHIPDRGPFILASNHSSHADTGVLLSGAEHCSSPVHPVAAKDYWFENEAIGWLVHNSLNAIPFDRRSRNMRDSFRLPVEILKQDHALIFYPEGGRTPGDNIRSFKNGIGVLSLASGAPVVPTYIQNTHKVMPKGKAELNRIPVTAYFAEPIQVTSYLERLTTDSGLQLAREITNQVHEEVLRLRDQANHE